MCACMWVDTHTYTRIPRVNGSPDTPTVAENILHVGNRHQGVTKVQPAPTASAHVVEGLYAGLLSLLFYLVYLSGSQSSLVMSPLARLARPNVAKLGKMGGRSHEVIAVDSLKQPIRPAQFSKRTQPGFLDVSSRSNVESLS